MCSMPSKTRLRPRGRRKVVVAVSQLATFKLASAYHLRGGETR